MNRNVSWVFRVLIFIFFSLNGNVYAQTTTDIPSKEFDTTSFPLWVRDLRRAEIVAFGSFPFTLFLTSFTMDTLRSANHNWDARYAPWLFRPAGGIDMNTNERLITIGAAAAGSVLISLVDYCIVQYKRNKVKKQSLNLPDGSPIIIRHPRPETDAETNGEDLSEDGEP
ncbi:MAG: hypothetical protein LBD65_06935 [Spirochaetaceae bacterium]|nr:hypothetical protein [Spirochaetaceae bacterium]